MELRGKKGSQASLAWMGWMPLANWYSISLSYQPCMQFLCLWSAILNVKQRFSELTLHYPHNTCMCMNKPAASSDHNRNDRTHVFVDTLSLTLSNLLPHHVVIYEFVSFLHFPWESLVCYFPHGIPIALLTLNASCRNPAQRSPLIKPHDFCLHWLSSTPWPVP